MEQGKAKTEGTAVIPGVPGQAAPVWLSFYQPQGSLFGTLLPTGNVVDRITTSRGPLSISIVDAAAPLVFVLASDIGLNGTELPEDFSTVQLSFFGRNPILCR